MFSFFTVLMFALVENECTLIPKEVAASFGANLTYYLHIVAR